MEIGQTQIDLGTEVLGRLGIVGSGETPEAADLEKAIDALNHIHERLRTLHKLRWSWSDMPEFMKWPYVNAAAVMCAKGFGAQADMSYSDAMALINAANVVPQPDHDAVIWVSEF